MLSVQTLARAACQRERKHSPRGREVNIADMCEAVAAVLDELGGRSLDEVAVFLVKHRDRRRRRRST